MHLPHMTIDNSSVNVVINFFIKFAGGGGDGFSLSELWPVHRRRRSLGLNGRTRGAKEQNIFALKCEGVHNITL